MSIKESFTSFWDRVTGKTLYEVTQTVKHLEDRMNMLQLDLDAANIKLASTEIDLEASNIEKEILKSELESKKAEIAKLNLTITNLKEENARNAAAITGAELEALTKKVAMEEYLASEYKNRLEQIVNMLTVMSKDEKYSDIIRIQTNSINEAGEEKRQVYMNYGDITVQVEEEVTAEATVATTATAGAGKESTWLNGGLDDIKVVSADEALNTIYSSVAELAEIELAIAEESVNDIAEELMAN